jgi:hypothetical protein
MHVLNHESRTINWQFSLSARTHVRQYMWRWSIRVMSLPTEFLHWCVKLFLIFFFDTITVVKGSLRCQNFIIRGGIITWGSVGGVPITMYQALVCVMCCVSHSDRECLRG